MPRYTFLLYAPDTSPECSADPEVHAARLSRRRDFESAVRASGARVVGGAELAPPETATTVRRPEPDEPAVLRDGPVLAEDQVLTGFYVIEAMDHEQALGLASVCPAAAVEVRAVPEA